MSAPEKVYVWFDPEGDFLEVIFEVKEGVFEQESGSPVNVKRDLEGNVLGFHILGVSKLEGPPFEVTLEQKSPETTR